MKKLILIFAVLVTLSACRTAMQVSNVDYQINALLSDTSFVSVEQEYWTDEDTVLRTFDSIVGIACIHDSDKIEMRISEGSDVAYSIYLEPQYSTHFIDDVYNTEYTGIDPNFEPVKVFYIMSWDYTRSAIIIQSEWYEVCLYMGKYR